MEAIKRVTLGGSRAVENLLALCQRETLLAGHDTFLVLSALTISRGFHEEALSVKGETRQKSVVYDLFDNVAVLAVGPDSFILPANMARDMAAQVSHRRWG